MIGSRLPSLQRQYDEYWSEDPAFVQPPEDATGEQRKEHANRVRIARETGDWSPLVAQNAQPTKFVMRPLKGALARKLLDDINFGRVGSAVLASIAFRAALVTIENGPTHWPAVSQVNHPDYGPLVAQEVADAIDGEDLAIIGELGGVILNRARGPSPKR